MEPGQNHPRVLDVVGSIQNKEFTFHETTIRAYSQDLDEDNFKSDEIYAFNCAWTLTAPHGRRNRRGWFVKCCKADKTNAKTHQVIVYVNITLYALQDGLDDMNRDFSHIYNGTDDDYGFTSLIAPEFLENFTDSKFFMVAGARIEFLRRVPIGLKNMSTVCYMNAVLQSLFALPIFRNAVFNADLDDKVVRELQDLFYLLLNGSIAPSPTYLFEASQWSNRFGHNDVHEFLWAFVSEIETLFKKTEYSTMVSDLFSGERISYIKCTNVDYKSTHKEIFNDLQLNIRSEEGRGMKNINESLERYLQPDILDGDNMYEAGQHGKQRAEKGIQIVRLPPVLFVYLIRYQFLGECFVKIEDQYDIIKEIDLNRFVEKKDGLQSDDNVYILHSVMAHCGDMNQGHYVVYVNSDPRGERDLWYKFDDDALNVLSFSAVQSECASNSCRSVEKNWTPCMFVYLKKSMLEKLMSPTKLPDNQVTKRLVEKYGEARLSVSFVTDKQIADQAKDLAIDRQAYVQYFNRDEEFKTTLADVYQLASERLSLALGTFRLWVYDTYRLYKVPTKEICWRPKVYIEPSDKNLAPLPCYCGSYTFYVEIIDSEKEKAPPQTPDGTTQAAVAITADEPRKVTNEDYYLVFFKKISNGDLHYVGSAVFDRRGRLNDDMQAFIKAAGITDLKRVHVEYAERLKILESVDGSCYEDPTIKRSGTVFILDDNEDDSMMTVMHDKVDTRISVVCSPVVCSTGEIGRMICDENNSTHTFTISTPMSRIRRYLTQRLDISASHIGIWSLMANTLIPDDVPLAQLVPSTIQHCSFGYTVFNEPIKNLEDFYLFQFTLKNGADFTFPAKWRIPVKATWTLEDVNRIIHNRLVRNRNQAIYWYTNEGIATSFGSDTPVKVLCLKHLPSLTADMTREINQPPPQAYIMASAAAQAAAAANTDRMDDDDDDPIDAGSEDEDEGIGQNRSFGPSAGHFGAMPGIRGSDFGDEIEGDSGAPPMHTLAFTTGGIMDAGSDADVEMDDASSFSAIGGGGPHFGTTKSITSRLTETTVVSAVKHGTLPGKQTVTTPNKGGHGLTTTTTSTMGARTDQFRGSVPRTVAGLSSHIYPAKMDTNPTKTVPLQHSPRAPSLFVSSPKAPAGDDVSMKDVSGTTAALPVTPSKTTPVHSPPLPGSNPSPTKTKSSTDA